MIRCRDRSSEAQEARSLGERRDRWVNPVEWVGWVDARARYPKRPVPRDEDAAEALKKRTLTTSTTPVPVARRCARRP